MEKRIPRLAAVMLILLVLLGAMLPTFVLAESTIPEWPPMKVRTVVPGDTYFAIAKEYGLSDWRDLQRVNGWEPTKIPAGATMKIPLPWYLVTGAFGDQNSGEVAETAKMLKNRVDTKIYGRYVGFGYLTVGQKEIPVCVAALGVGPENVYQMVEELYSIFPTQPVLQIHGGINGNLYEVGSSVIPKKVCSVNGIYNYPVLGPAPIFPNKGESLNALAKRLGWTEAEVKIAIERNPGKLPTDRNAPIRDGIQLVGPRDEIYNDHLIPRGYTLYFRDGTSWSPPNGCLEVPDDLFKLAESAAKAMELPTVPVSITKYIEANGRDPKEATTIHVGPDECLCGGDTFYASPVTAWWVQQLFGCDGLDMETPTVGRITASVTGQKQPRVVYFRTSSDPPHNNPGRPEVTASQYLKDPAGTYKLARTALTQIFALPVTPHQSRVYASFVKAFLALYVAGK